MAYVFMYLVLFAISWYLLAREVSYVQNVMGDDIWFITLLSLIIIPSLCIAVYAMVKRKFNLTEKTIYMKKREDG